MTDNTARFSTDYRSSYRLVELAGGGIEIQYGDSYRPLITVHRYTDEPPVAPLGRAMQIVNFLNISANAPRIAAEHAQMVTLLRETVNDYDAIPESASALDSLDLLARIEAE